MHLTHIRTFNTCIINMQDILSSIYKHAPTDKILFYEQAVHKRGPKW